MNPPQTAWGFPRKAGFLPWESFLRRGSDLNQTAEFSRTKTGREMNPLAHALVHYKGNTGEILMGGAGILTIYYLETSPRFNRETVTLIETLWTIGHLMAIYHNYQSSNGRLNGINIIFPYFEIKF